MRLPELPPPAVPGLPAPGRCLVMAVVNVTPDSFSDGGRYLATEAAVRQGLALHSEGADIVDVGGESTRPGAQRVDAAEERRRVVPVVAALAEHGLTVTVDTMRAEVATAAVDAGAAAVNDVSGGLADAAMLPLVAERGVPVVLMHWRGHSVDMQRRTHYDDVVADVAAHLAARVDQAVGVGVDPQRIVVDPGLGFAKTAAHNWALLARLDALVDLGQPVLVGPSRKAFLGALLAVGDRPRPVEDREDATTAVTALAAAGGAWGVRVHHARAAADAVRVAAAWSTGQATGGTALLPRD